MGTIGNMQHCIYKENCSGGFGSQMKTETMWEEDEITILEESAGFQSIESIARKLNRTPNAVRSKLNRLGITSIRELDGSMSLMQLAQALGVSRSVVERWIEEKNLPAMKKNYYYYKRNKVKHYSIYPDEFWEWAENHKDEINFAKIKRHTILPEPDWFEEERIKDLSKPKNANKNWTPSEDEQLLFLYKAGRSYSYIANHFGRSVRSVQARIGRLRKNKSL